MCMLTLIDSKLMIAASIIQDNIMAMKDKLYFYLDTTVTIVHIHPILARQEPGTCIQLIQSQSQPQGVAQLRKTYLNHTEDKATYSRYLGVLELLSACMWYMLWTGLHGM